MGASDPMLLTLPRPVNTDFGFKHAHDFIPPPPISTKRPSVKADQDALSSLQAGAPEKMGTPHRGLPPPSAMTLGPPEPVRSIPPPLSTSFSGMPEPPRQWQGAEESMNRWLLTKAEEEKRKQEEERTRQESLRLEQRRIEQGILLEAIRSGIPPHLVPIIFAGIGSHSVANLSVEWLQQYNNSLHAAQQQQLSSGPSQPAGSPDIRRERLIAGPQPYPPSAPVPGAGAAPQPPAGPSSAPYGYGSNPMSPTMRTQPPPSGPPSSSIRGPLQQVLPRLATEEQRAPPAHQAPSGAVQPAQMQMGQHEQSASSPGGGIFFHHWQPPSSSQSGGGNQPPTPSEYTNSPKRRKAQVLQPPSMPPTSEPRYNSSSFVHVTSPAGSTSGGRKRRLSDTSTTNRPGYATSGRKNRSRGNTESSAAISEEDRLRYRQYPVGGQHEDRSDTGSHSSNYHQQAAKRSRRSYDHGSVSGPNSPKREQQLATALSSRKNSFGPVG